MTSRTTNKFSHEVRERAVRMLLDHIGAHPSRWAAVVSIAEKIGCSAQSCTNALGRLKWMPASGPGFRRRLWRS